MTTKATGGGWGMKSIKAVTNFCNTGYGSMASKDKRVLKYDTITLNKRNKETAK